MTHRQKWSVEPERPPLANTSVNDVWADHGWALSGRDVAIILIVVLIVSAITRGFLSFGFWN